MKIAMIGQKGIPSRAGGIEIHVEELSKRLVQLGLKVDVYCRKGYCRAEETGYNGIELKYAPYIQTKHMDSITHTFFATIKALLAKTDIFHYHALGPSTLAFIPRLLGKKVVCTVHGLDWKRGKWGGFAKKYLLFGEYSTAQFSHMTINVSNNLVHYYKSKYHKETVYIPNGIEKKDIMEPDIIRRKYSLGKDGYILFLARLVPEKGAHYLIEAYKSIDTCKKLVIAGGASHSEEYVKSIYHLAGNDDRILFTGHVEGNELAELYSNAYLYVLPSDIEGLPISLLEAMSYGNCCLTSDIKENASVIEEMGYTFKSGDVNDLRRVLAELLEKGNEINKIKSKVRKFVLEKYNWDEAAYKTLQVYNNVMERATQGVPSA